MGSYIILESMCCTLLASNVGGHRKLEGIQETNCTCKVCDNFHIQTWENPRCHKKNGGANLVRPYATHFATFFLTLKSLYKHKDALKSLFGSTIWTDNRLVKTNVGLNVYIIVFSTQFWNSVEYCLRASGPLLITLRVVDGDERPAMPEVQALMKCANEKINQSFVVQSKRSFLKKIMTITERCWEKTNGSPNVWGCNVFEPKKVTSSHN
jgi:hypothetical protein